MATKLTSTAQWQFTRVEKPNDCPPIAKHLSAVMVYEVALCLGFVPTPEAFAAYLEDGTISIWQCAKPHDGKTIAYAIDVFRFDDHEMFIWCVDGWDNGLVAELLPLLSGAVFEADAKATRVWMVIPTPLPKGSEACVMTLGFDAWKDDMAKGLKATYGLDRETWRIYSEKDPS